MHIRCSVPFVVPTLDMFSLMGRVQLDFGSYLSFFLPKLNLTPWLSGIASTVPPLILWRTRNRRDGEKHQFDRFIKKIYYLWLAMLWYLLFLGGLLCCKTGSLPNREPSLNTRCFYEEVIKVWLRYSCFFRPRWYKCWIFECSLEAS